MFGPLGGTQQVGDDVYTTLDTQAQASPSRNWPVGPGSVVAINPQNGPCWRCTPTPRYDDNNPKAPCRDSCQLNSAA